MCNKPEDIQAYIVDNALDIPAVTETWLKKDDSVTAADLGLSLMHVSHSSRGEVVLHCSVVNTTQPKVNQHLTNKTCSFDL